MRDSPPPVAADRALQPSWPEKDMPPDWGLLPWPSCRTPRALTHLQPPFTSASPRHPIVGQASSGWGGPAPAPALAPACGGQQRWCPQTWASLWGNTWASHGTPASFFTCWWSPSSPAQDHPSSLWGQPKQSRTWTRPGPPPQGARPQPNACVPAPLPPHLPPPPCSAIIKGRKRELKPNILEGPGR